jgi:hypothetical protein
MNKTMQGMGWVLGATTLSVLLLSGCDYVGKPNAQVDFSSMVVQVKNQDPQAQWEGCRFMIRAHPVSFLSSIQVKPRYQYCL